MIDKLEEPLEVRGCRARATTRYLSVLSVVSVSWGGGARVKRGESKAPCASKTVSKVNSSSMRNNSRNSSPRLGNASPACRVINARRLEVIVIR
jgi:hypothetical protein